jgi:hypothetical protein
MAQIPAIASHPGLEDFDTLWIRFALQSRRVERLKEPFKTRDEEPVKGAHTCAAHAPVGVDLLLWEKLLQALQEISIHGMLPSTLYWASQFPTVRAGQHSRCKLSLQEVLPRREPHLKPWWAILTSTSISATQVGLLHWLV